MRFRGLARCVAAIGLLLASLLPTEAAAWETSATDRAASTSALDDTVTLAGWATSGALIQEPIELFRVRLDPRMCPSPFCGGAFVSRVNQPDTHCADGEYREACYVTRIDLDPVELTDPQLAHIYGVLYSGQVIVAGRIEQTFSPAWGLFGEFRASDVWRSATESAVDSGVIFRARDNGMRCIAAPCFSYDLVVANTGELMTVSELGLTNVGATPEMVAAANDALFTSGLLVTGSMHELPGAGPAGDGRLFDASQFYIPVTRGIIIPPVR